MERDMFKQRIVGGLVLVALGAIVIPFLLDMHQDGRWWGKGNIPPEPANGFVTRVLPLDDWAQQTRTALAQAKPAADEHVPAATTPASAPAAAPAVATPVAATLQEGWMVQLASFSSAANAEELRQRLQAKGYRVRVEDLHQDGQAIYRVRIGPEAERAAAESLRDRVERDFHLKGVVMRSP
jgi:DedD protein